MKKAKKIALIIMFIVGLILMVAIEYDNNTTAKKIRNEREKIEARLEAVRQAGRQSALSCKHSRNLSFHRKVLIVSCESAGSSQNGRPLIFL